MATYVQKYAFIGKTFGNLSIYFTSPLAKKVITLNDFPLETEQVPFID